MKPKHEGKTVNNPLHNEFQRHIHGQALKDKDVCKHQVFFYEGTTSIHHFLMGYVFVTFEYSSKMPS